VTVRATIRAFVIVGGAFAGGVLSGAAVVREAVAGVWSDYAGLDTLARAITTIERRYIEPVEPERLAHAAVTGMTDSLDQHSTYHPPAQWAALAEEADGSGSGIGIDLRLLADRVEVSRVVPEGPADLAGVVVGMRVTAIDGQAVDTPATAEARIRGPLGQPVVLSGMTSNDGPFELAVVRDSFEDVRVGGSPLPNGLFYIRIGRFTRGAIVRFDQQVERMAPDTRGLILDLRGNPGGLLSEAGAIADRFLTEGVIVETVARNSVVDGQVVATRQDDDVDVAVAVLVDGHSASAAEVLAGALQARDRAQIIGTPTYGKGSVQSIIEFEDGGALRLTTAAYRLPDGRTIDLEHPLVPDLVVAPMSTHDPRAELGAAIDAYAPDPSTREALRSALGELKDPPLDPGAPPPIPLGATVAEYIGRDAPLDAAIALLQGG
jgi:carboxyl-terminal processing protease